MGAAVRLQTSQGTTQLRNNSRSAGGTLIEVRRTGTKGYARHEWTQKRATKQRR